ncbi:MAG: phosphate-selective porin, partial [Myxococcaceae bacterium]|nr:phosphate-selective porin [Myxococcaceae bacterium]
LWQTGLLGVRYDFYDPNPDAASNVAGAVVKASQRISTISAVAGLQLPGTRTRFFAEYDRVKDHLALGLNGRPSDLKNDRFLCRLQVSLW